jgi:hypothetical protein
LSVRVVPRDDPGAWLIREPTAKVFDDNSIVQANRQGADTFNRQPFQVFVVLISALMKTSEKGIYTMEPA